MNNQNLHQQASSVDHSDRASQKQQRPAVLWFTGLSGAGKSTLANLVDLQLFALGYHAYLLDGDNVRRSLCADLGFSVADRAENIRRVAAVAGMMADAGLIVLAAFISPFRAERVAARQAIGADRFYEIFVDTPLALAEHRDVKGLYKKARRGEIKNFTGIDSVYEPPVTPALIIETEHESPEQSAERIVAFLRESGVVKI